MRYGSAVALFVGLATLGCNQEGPKVYRVSGAITFDGAPVPAGIVIFDPDVKQKNAGPQGTAEIRDGRYDTHWTGRGTVGGPVLVTVGGTTKEGRALCRYDFKADLPRGDSVQDVRVPKSATTTGAPAEGP